ncbi:RNA methyltransferase [Alkalitalea saponilacus]|uniref:SpoU rRNA Methylase family protein n=1 Tax=Alkalitalea saponilacus TaxID=889453 RepID=A0A1T5EPJ7_9BACT|nr:RNA methyltransferase [Alkalitalea saponilacus]ASB48066.1 RNA methyltransferase [Alkalitalea saponilacus]SKB85778.1 SpoU rRNA Methylase family protein [Alkalitalea saponilacus]
MRKLRITELNRLTPEEFKVTGKIEVVIILDNVRSLHNVGSVFRTADAFCIKSICLCGITATPPHNEIHKTALGAEDTVSWKYFEKTEDAVNELINHDYRIIGIEQVENSIQLNHFSFNASEKYAIIFGNEVKGVQQAVINMCNDCIEIPQFGTKHSLNVSVSAGVVLWEMAKKIHPKLNA